MSNVCDFTENAMAYFLKFDDESEQRVSKSEFIAAERACGFKSRFGYESVAVGWFSAADDRGRQVRGRTQTVSNFLI